MTSNQKANSN